MKVTFRTIVCKRAQWLAKSTGKSYHICLAKSWVLYRLVRDMHRNIVQFAYEKSDGTFRRAQGTLRNVEHRVKGNGRENYRTIRYYDVEANAFRSFKIENFITVY
ncbi:MAG: SH3 beta-barrel fold-containing protein [Tannerellaceae bacterium]|nr:SH3 beta-barrel fold-containing protein [Tannerellaceae bacterium]MCD7712087.1 SH3 beta-barrel fold-containing protein [Bacillota bacterium]MCD7914067.1 SH3 beta-barrel fold-containing protein [Tannerellaceae bacterium]